LIPSAELFAAKGRTGHREQAGVLAESFLCDLCALSRLILLNVVGSTAIPRVFQPSALLARALLRYNRPA
jgi:hypothetical protein